MADKNLTDYFAGLKSKGSKLSRTPNRQKIVQNPPPLVPQLLVSTPDQSGHTSTGGRQSLLPQTSKKSTTKRNFDLNRFEEDEDFCIPETPEKKSLPSTPVSKSIKNKFSIIQRLMEEEKEDEDDFDKHSPFNNNRLCTTNRSNVTTTATSSIQLSKKSSTSSSRSPQLIASPFSPTPKPSSPSSPLSSNHQHSSSLDDYELPSGVIDYYKDKGVTNIFEWQHDCLQIPGVLDGNRNLVFSAPTSAGKTIISDVLMIQNVIKRKLKSLLVLPFISLANEKTFALQAMLKHTGISVGGFMGNSLPTGQFPCMDIAVCTIERANNIINYLIEQNETHILGTVVIDELHLLADPHRGPLLETLISKLLYIQNHLAESSIVSMQLIGMSATLPNLIEIGQWMQATTYKTDFRPVKLTEKIKIGDKLYDVSTGDVLEELDKRIPFQKDSNDSLRLALDTVLKGDGVLIFCPSKNNTEECAKLLANQIKFLGEFIRTGNPNEAILLNAHARLRANLSREKIVPLLCQLERTPVQLDRTLYDTISYGVAFHHSGLSTEERDLIESGFRDGTIKALFATPTLCSGVNLPARRVIIRSTMIGRSQLSPLTYRQMIGRAGRQGQYSSGDSILACKESECDIAKKLCKQIIPPITSSLVALPMEGFFKLDHTKNQDDHIRRACLEVIANKLLDTAEQLHTYLNLTFAAHTQRQFSLAECEAILLTLSTSQQSESTTSTSTSNVAIKSKNSSKADNNITTRQLLFSTRREDGRLQFEITRLGSGVYTSCMLPQEAYAMFDELKKAMSGLVLNCDLHLLYFSIQASYVRDKVIDWEEYDKIFYEVSKDSFYKDVADRLEISHGYIHRRMTTTNQIDRPGSIGERHKRFYFALALNCLIEEEPLLLVCRRYRLIRGDLQMLQKDCARHAGMISLFCRKIGWFTIATIIKLFHDRLYFGVSGDLVDLMNIPCLSAKMARVLFDAHIEEFRSVAHKGYLEIESIIRRTVAEKVANKPILPANADPMEVAKVEAQLKSWLSHDCKDLSEEEIARLIVDQARDIVQESVGVAIDWNQQMKPLQLESQHSTHYSGSFRPSSSMSRLSDVGASASSTAVRDYRHSFVGSKKPPVFYGDHCLVPKSGTIDRFKSQSNDFPKPLLQLLPKLESPTKSTDFVLPPFLSQMPPIDERWQEQRPSSQSSATDGDLDEIDSQRTPKRSLLVDEQSGTSQKEEEQEHCSASAPLFDDSSSCTLTNASWDERSRLESPPKRLRRSPNVERIHTTATIVSTSKLNLKNVLKKAINEPFGMKTFSKKKSTVKQQQCLSKFVKQKSNLADKDDDDDDDDDGDDVYEINESSGDEDYVQQRQQQQRPTRAKPIVAATMSARRPPPIQTLQTMLPLKLRMTKSLPTSPEQSSVDEIPETQVPPAIVSLDLNKSDEEEDKVSKMDDPNRSAEVFIFSDSESEISQPTSVVANVGGAGGVKGGSTTFCVSSKSPPPPPSILSIDKTRGILSDDDDDGGGQAGRAKWLMDLYTNVAPKLTDYLGEDQSKKMYKTLKSNRFDSFLQNWKECQMFAISVKYHSNVTHVPGNIQLDLIKSVAITFNQDPIVYWIDDRDTLFKLRDKLLKPTTTTTSTTDFKFVEKSVICNCFDSKQVHQLLAYDLGMSSCALDCIFWADIKLVSWLLNPDVKEPKQLISLVNEWLCKSKSGGLLSQKIGQSSDKTRDFYAIRLSFGLMDCLLKQLVQNCMFSVYQQVEQPVLFLFGQMERHGLKIDRQYLNTILIDWRLWLDRLQAEARQISGNRNLNINSKIQVAHAVFPNSRSGKASKVSGELLDKMRSTNPFCGLVRDFRRLDHVITSLTSISEKNGQRVCGQYVHWNVTGRVAMDHPNLLAVSKDFEIMLDGQSIPISMRRAFIAESNFVLVSADFSQLELRILAILSDEPALIEPLNSSADIFRSIAAHIHSRPVEQISSDERGQAKVICYSLIYGQGDKGLSEKLSMDETATRRFRTQFENRFPKLMAYMESCKRRCFEEGQIRTMTGRPRLLPEIKSISTEERAAAGRKAVNTTVQGSASDLVKMSMLHVQNKIRTQLFEAHFLLQIHDELLFEVRADQSERFMQMLYNEMPAVAAHLPVKFPVCLRTGPNWSELNDWNPFNKQPKI